MPEACIYMNIYEYIYTRMDARALLRPEVAEGQMPLFLRYQDPQGQLFPIDHCRPRPSTPPPWHLLLLVYRPYHHRLLRQNTPFLLRPLVSKSMSVCLYVCMLVRTYVRMCMYRHSRHTYAHASARARMRERERERQRERQRERERERERERGRGREREGEGEQIQ